MNLSAVQLQVEIPHEIVQYWGWFLAFGIAVTLLGVAAVVRSFAATVVSMLFFGWLLVFAGGIEVAQAVMVGHWAGFFHHLLAAILFGIAGLLLVTQPMKSAEVLTMFMAMFFLVGGLFQVCRFDRGRATGMELAGGRWPHNDGAGPAYFVGMAGVGTLGDRPLYRD